ncbi:MAG: hypothetical protein P4L84_02245 [Isosphaeraceae bacterium]|nr:hypothetical protein [Isosphaeraceae bacterium]
MSAVYDERGLRRPEWAGGTPLLLPDGQAWWFYEPEPELVEEAGVSAVLWDFGLASDEENVALCDALYKVLGKLVRAETAEQRVSAVVELSWLLLARNYEITPEQYEKVLNVGPISAGLWGRLEGFVVAIEERARGLVPA